MLAQRKVAKRRSKLGTEIFRVAHVSFQQFCWMPCYYFKIPATKGGEAKAKVKVFPDLVCHVSCYLHLFCYLIMSVERMNNGFWLQREAKLRKLEVVWYNEQLDENQAHIDYSMGGELDGSFEKIVGNHLLLAGPLIDFYLKEIGTEPSLKNFIEVI